MYFTNNLKKMFKKKSQGKLHWKKKTSDALEKNVKRKLKD